MKKKLHITEALGIAAGVWVWCLHCERCYQAGEYRAIEGLQMCPYDGCNGDTVLDAWEWQGVQGNHAEYPKVPERGKVYPLYGPSKEAAKNG